jgi:hypothetical protein
MEIGRVATFNMYEVENALVKPHGGGSIIVENPNFLTIFSSIAHHLQLRCNWDFKNLKLKLWQSLIKSTHLLYWYIVENIFQLSGHLPNAFNVNNVFKLNA